MASLPRKLLPSRRSILALLGLGPAVAIEAAAAHGATPPPAKVAAAAPLRRTVRLIETHLAGTAYHHHEALRDRLAPGTPLDLRREPTNRHDARAIAVHFEGRRIGYVPRAHNRILASLMDAGETVSARYIAGPAAPGDDPRLGVDLLV